MDKVDVKPVVAVGIANPLAPLSTRARREFAPGCTVRDCVNAIWPLLPAGRELVIAIDGTPQDDAQAALGRVLAAGQSVVFHARPTGGIGSGLTDLIAMVALSVIAPYAVAPLTPFFAAAGGGSIFGGSLAFTMQVVGGAFTIGAGALMSAFVGTGATPSAASAQSSTDQSPSWSDAPNPVSEDGCWPVIYGTVRMKPRVISWHKTYDGDKQYLHWLGAIADHAVDSVGQVYINGNPLEFYGDSVTVEERLGALDQTPISFFNESVSEKSVNMKLSTSYVTARTDGNACQGLAVVLCWTQGLGYWGSGGAFTEVSAKIQIQRRKVGETEWTNIGAAEEIVKAATGSPLYKVFRADNVDEAGAQFDVRVKFTEEPETGDRYRSDCYLVGIQEIIYDDFAYPGRSVLGLKILANDLISTNTSLTVEATPTRSTVPVWTGSTYASKSASNPSWAAWDLLHNGDYGGNVPVSRIITTAFEDWADWLDTKPLYRVNLCMDSVSTHRSWMDQVAMLGRGAVVQMGTKFTPIVERPEPAPAQRFMFNVANIRRYSFKEKMLSMDDRATCVEVTYRDKDSGYSEQMVTLYADNHESAPQAKTTQVKLLGCDNTAQALAHAKSLLNKNRYLTNTVTFGADVDAIGVWPGQIIDVAHDLPQWGFSGLVLESTENVTEGGVTTATLTLDREVDLAPGTSYAVQVKLDDDTRLEYPVQAVAESTTTDVLIVDGGWDEGGQPEPDALYSFGPVGQITKPFTVLSINRADDFTRTLTCLEYNENIFDDEVDVPVVVNPSQLAFVTGLGATEDWLVLDGVAYARVGLSWRGTALSWSVSMRVVGSEQWTSLGTTTNPFYEASGLVAGTDYEFRVSARGDSEMVALSYVGRPTAPEPVSSLSASVSAQGITATWQRNTAPWISGYDIELDGTVLEQGYAGNSYTFPPCSATAHTIRVRARDLFGQVGPWASTSATPQAPAAPSVTLAIEGGQIRVAWAHNTRSFALANSEILHGDTLAGATSLGSSLTNTSIQFPGAAGSHKFWVRDTDVAGNTGPAGMAELVISAPGQVAISPQVIDNNVLLAWTEAAGTLPVADCELRRGATYAGSTLIGRIAGRFSTVFETVSGTYTYWITQRDVAGNDGAPSPITVQVSQPPDYVLQSDMASAFGGTKTNALLDGGALLMPVDTVSTVSARMTAGGWASRQAKASAGYPYRLEPTPAGASYVEVIDYGAVLAGTKITVTQTSQLIHGSVALSCNLKVRASTSDAWTDLGNVWSAYGTNFRYVQVTITATPDGGSNDLLKLIELRIRLDVKLKNDAGSATCNSGDSGGTQVNFNVSFVDIQSITLTPAAGGSARYALYDFTDAPNPTGFKILLYDASGNRVSGTCSWSAKGV